jgi:hypothetical protein
MKRCLIYQITALSLLLTGCSARLARENVFANTESAFGLTLAENPQTQIYELKLGYARHELFYVPTSKMIFYNGGGSGLGNEVAPPGMTDYNDPSKVPDVVAEIQVGGNGSSNGTNSPGGSFNIRQRLAVGSVAVKSPSASALFGSQVVDTNITAQVDTNIFTHFSQALFITEKVFPAPNNTATSTPNSTALQQTIKGTPLTNQVASISKLLMPDFENYLSSRWFDLIPTMYTNLLNQ